MIPDERAAHELHRKYGSNEHIVSHCETVSRVARILTRRLAEKGVPLNEKAVVAAALLHDIGRTRTQTVHHGYTGAGIVESEGVDGDVAGIIRRHVGAGISREEADSLGFPPGDYVPRSLEERIVCFADKLVDGARVRPFSAEVERFRRKGHDVERLLALKKSLEDELARDPEKVVQDEMQRFSYFKDNQTT